MVMATPDVRVVGDIELVMTVVAVVQRVLADNCLYACEVQRRIVISRGCERVNKNGRHRQNGGERIETALFTAKQHASLITAVEDSGKIAPCDIPSRGIGIWV